MTESSDCRTDGRRRRGVGSHSSSTSVPVEQQTLGFELSQYFIFSINQQLFSAIIGQSFFLKSNNAYMVVYILYY